MPLLGSKLNFKYKERNQIHQKKIFSKLFGPKHTYDTEEVDSYTELFFANTLVHTYLSFTGTSQEWNRL